MHGVRWLRRPAGAVKGISGGSMKTLMLVILAVLAVIFTGGVGLIPIVGIWILGYIGQRHHGTAKAALDGKPSPRAEGRAPDDNSHWFTEDGCGTLDRWVYGLDIVEKRKAFRERWQSDPKLRSDIESAESRAASRVRTLFFAYALASAVLIAILVSTSSSIPGSNKTVFMVFGILSAPVSGGLLAAFTSLVGKTPNQHSF